jgi:hypothetical protein
MYSGPSSQTADVRLFSAVQILFVNLHARSLRRRLYPLYNLNITTFLLHCGCALLSHRSVERLNSVPVSISELHPHVRHIIMQQHVQPEARKLSCHTEFIAREPSPMNGTFSIVSIGLTHPFRIGICGRIRADFLFISRSRAPFLFRSGNAA